MILCRWLVLILTICFVWSATAELEIGEDGLPTKNMLEHLEPYEGQWHITIESEPTELNPKKQTYSAVQEARLILDGTMFQFRAVTTIDGKDVESLVLIGFDQIEKAYCSWFYAQDGLYVKSKIDWAEDGKSYTSSSLDKERLGATATSEVDLIDDNTIQWANQVILNDDRQLVKTKFVAKRKNVEINYPRREEKQKDKLAMYRPYAGEWESVTKGQATRFIKEMYQIEKSYQLTGKWVQRDILGGDIVETRGSSTGLGEPPHTYLWIKMYSPQEESYIAWYKDSRGNTSKMFGSWSEKHQKMTWTLDERQAFDMKVTSVDDLAESDMMRFAFKMEGVRGIMVIDEAGYAVRVKEVD